MEEVEVKRPRRVRGAGVANRGGTHSYPLTYGDCYVLTLYSSYAMLYRCAFDEEGNGQAERLSSSSSHVRLDETGDAKFELRCDRESGSITLYVDGQFISQWNDPKGYAGKGGQLAFCCQNADSRLRISDVAVTSWNGMIDSALSMESKERDVVLLTNGTDRFSGEVLGISEDLLTLKGTFAEMQIPLENVEEIRFASNAVKELPAPTGQAVRLVLQPVGRLTVEPQGSTAEVMTGKLASGDLAELELNHVGIMEFAFGDSALDSWDDDF